MKRILLAMVMVGLLAGQSHALDFTITKVIDVGPGQAEPMTWPLKWSPDGTKLAFFNGNPCIWPIRWGIFTKSQLLILRLTDTSG